MIDVVYLLQMDPFRLSSTFRILLQLSPLAGHWEGWDPRKTFWWKVILRLGLQLCLYSAEQSHLNLRWAVLLISCKPNPAKGISSNLMVEFSRGFSCQHCLIELRPSFVVDSWRKSMGNHYWSKRKNYLVRTDHEWYSKKCSWRLKEDLMTKLFNLSFSMSNSSPWNWTLNRRLRAAGCSILATWWLSFSIIPIVKVFKRVFFLSWMPPCYTPILYAFNNRIRFEIVWFCLQEKFSIIRITSPAENLTMQ